ncbi:glutathione S-transferase family protein [Paracoccus pacificus]|uniref:Glutathione S-transferase family protein n=1 Tax=Paracoccus pacificus TaxID=1463598 RepID=A0ABW4R484_9RHOB
MSLITVHHLNDSRSQRVLWALEEMGRDYEIIRYQRDPRTMLAPPALRAIHPLGKSPVIEDGAEVVAETGAILEYLTEGAPSDLRPDRATGVGRRVTYWLHYAEGSAMTPLLLRLIFDQMPVKSPALFRPVARGIAGRMNDLLIQPQLETHIGYWEDDLSEGHFAGPDFTIADIVMSFPVEMAALRVGLGDKPALHDWLARMHARPAYQRALERGGPYSGGAAT